MNGKTLLLLILLGFVAIVFIPFPFGLIICIIAGAILGWTSQGFKMAHEEDIRRQNEQDYYDSLFEQLYQKEKLGTTGTSMYVDGRKVFAKDLEQWEWEEYTQWKEFREWKEQTQKRNEGDQHDPY